jgi:putative endonuclease
MLYFVYILKSQKDSSYYTGMAVDVSNRLIEHNRGKSQYTKSKIPWKIVYTEGPYSSAKARKREKELKRSENKKEILR